MEISREMVDKIRAGLPELPDAKQERFVSQYGLTEYDAAVISQTVESAVAFEEIAKTVTPKVAANWLMGDVARLANESEVEVAASGLGIGGLTTLVTMVEKGTINGSVAKTLLDELYVPGGDPEAIVKERGLGQVNDSDELGRIVDEVIAANEGVVADYKGGKVQALQALVGQVMKATRGRANAQSVNQLLRDRLG
jgi:aspartyl-tRNA(Asn)/glutamyl-tRNA(Gln) amidotransferase subunit B